MDQHDFQKKIEIIQTNVRKAKDVLKGNIKKGIFENNLPDFGIIMPPLTFQTNKDLQADQWFANGFVVKNNDDLLIVDPGVDFYSRFCQSGLDMNKVRAIIVTHNHIDHADALNIFLEKILKYESSSFDVILSQYHYNNELKPYLRDKITASENIALHLMQEATGQHKILLKTGLEIHILPLFHTAKDTFGFKMRLGGNLMGHISDTGYTKMVNTNKGSFEPHKTEGEFLSISEKHEYIKAFFNDCQTMIININDLAYNRHSKFHLSGYDVQDILAGSVCKRLILQHLNVVNAEGEDSNYLYKLFFMGEKYSVRLPHYCGFIEAI